jgi:hypothetical protein
MAAPSQLGTPPTTAEQYDAEDDFTDCEITCADGETVLSHRNLLRVVPWFKNAFKMHKTLPVKLELRQYPKRLVQKLVNFCAPTMVLSGANSGWVPDKEDIPAFVAMVDFFSMDKQKLAPSILDTFVTKVLNPIGAKMTASLLVPPTNDDEEEKEKEKTRTRPAANVLSPRSIQYLYSHITIDGWPEYDDVIGPEGFMALARSGVDMKTILSRYSSSSSFFTDELCALYADGPKEDLSTLVEIVHYDAPNAAALVNRFISVGVRPLVLLRTDLEGGPSSRVATFGWRLGWPLNPFTAWRRAAFVQLLENIVDNPSLTADEVRQIRELICIVDEVDVPRNTIAPPCLEIAALLGYYLANNHSSYLCDPRLDPASPSKTIHDLVETAGASVRKTVFLKHLEKHKLLNNHTIAVKFYSVAQ